MFELSIAKSYLRPRRKQLSVSIISTISILVIALVVWLVVVFFSVTDGLLGNWVNKLVALTAPVRVTPTEAYYQSYYYQVDGISADSEYTLKSIAEKLEAEAVDPYDPELDEEIPHAWPRPDVTRGKELKDLVKLAKQSILEATQVTPLSAKDYELTIADLHLDLLKPHANQNHFAQTTFIGSYDENNKFMKSASLPPTSADLNHLLQNLNHETDSANFRKKLAKYFSHVTVASLKPSADGWKIPFHLLAEGHSYRVFAMQKGRRIKWLVLPQDAACTEAEDPGGLCGATLIRSGDKLEIVLDGSNQKKRLAPTRVYIREPIIIRAALDPFSIQTAKEADDIIFDVGFTIQQSTIEGKSSLRSLDIAEAAITLDSIPPLWAYEDENHAIRLPKDNVLGEGVLLPKTFKEGGVGLGDRGYLAYNVPSASHYQEQQIPVFVAGFYDPGIIPIGGKYVLASDETTRVVRTSHGEEDRMLTNGFNVRFDDLKKANDVKSAIEKNLTANGIAPYWKVETFREYSFTKDIMQQLASEKNLFTILATIVIIVACSNIISMLIILVNDKRVEIGIVRALGGTTVQIATIFGACGLFMGVLGSILGTIAALVTLANLDALIYLISSLQGHEMFNPNFYGESLPNHMSVSAVSFVVITTASLSLIAGVVAAIKACLMKPSAILRME